MKCKHDFELKRYANELFSICTRCGLIEGSPTYFTTKIYLGDSVYARYDGYHIQLTNENGDQIFDRIALDPYVTKALLNFINSIYENVECDHIFTVKGDSLQVPAEAICEKCGYEPK